MSEQRKGRNWRCKYLTIEKFEKFLSNDFHDVKLKLTAVLWLTGLILAAIIYQWATK